jgi:hypothetical protein
MIADLKKIRREISARLVKAEREGRFMEEWARIESEGDRAYREALKPVRNGRRRK